MHFIIKYLSVYLNLTHGLLIQSTFQTNAYLSFSYSNFK